jgi:hypothetical protein
MVGMALAMLYLLRINLSLTLVCMVHKERIGRPLRVHLGNGSTDGGNETLYSWSMTSYLHNDGQRIEKYQVTSLTAIQTSIEI